MADANASSGSGVADYPWGHHYVEGDEWNTIRAYRTFAKELSKRTLAIWGRPIYPEGFASFSMNGPPGDAVATVNSVNGRYVGRDLTGIIVTQADAGLPIRTGFPGTLNTTTGDITVKYSSVYDDTAGNYAQTTTLHVGNCYSIGFSRPFTDFQTVFQSATVGPGGPLVTQPVASTLR